MAARLRAALSEQGLDNAEVIPQYPAAGTLAALAAKHAYNLCFLDVATAPEEALALIPEAARALPVVAVNPRKDADLILYCVRLGASEFLSDPTGDEVRSLLERMGRSLEPAETSKPCIAVCVLPGKAGAGASTVAAYLASEMKRVGLSKVLLVDTDTAAGTVAFLLKLKPAFHLEDAIRDWDRMDADLWAQLAKPWHSIDVLPAPEEAPVRLEIPSRAALGLLSFWREHYEAIVLDVAGVHAPGNVFAPLADSVLVVSGNDLGALHATRRTWDFLKKTADESKLKLVVNRHNLATGLDRQNVEAALKMRAYAALPADGDAVQSALLDGRPLAPGSHLARAIHTLAERLLGKQQAARKRSSFFGLLR